MRNLFTDPCDRLDVLTREWHMLMDKAYSYRLDPITNEYPPEAQRFFTLARGNEKLQWALMRQMDEERMGQPEGTRT